MPSYPLLHGKRAVVFGAGGSIGSAVAKAFASEGAEVFLVGRSEESLQVVAKEIAEAGGRARPDVIDALDEPAVEAYIHSVAQEAGGIDIEFNATGPRVSEYANLTPAVDLPADLFMVPVNTALKSNYITARAAAREMVKQGTGVIMFLTGSPARPHLPNVTAIGAAFGAIENLMRTMAIELGPAGVRVVCLRTALNPDSRTSKENADLSADRMGVPADHEQFAATLARGTMLQASPSTTDTARAAVLLASDSARIMTGTVQNSSAGLVWD
jgi:NAD(P)-dependent dehydrogenase (short-subunit alcohol dehydrogenase family)